MKIALGGVQFGLNYGIGNTSGQVKYNEVQKILDFSIKNGIDTLDTAPLYGNSEIVLGKIGINDFNIITKTTSLTLGVNSVIESFHESLKNLRISSVNGLLIHNIEDILDKNFDSLYNQLVILKNDKLINKIGFSTYFPEQVDFLLENFDFDLIQVPINVFDTRLIENGQLQKLKNKKIEIHARSIFLQGLLLDFKKLDNYFDKWISQFNNYQDIVKASNLTLLEYALNFVLNIQEIDKVLVGVNSEKHLIEITEAIMSLKNIQAYPLSDINLLNPSLWKI